MEKIEQKAILVGLCAKKFDDSLNSTDETLDELQELLETAGGESLFKVIQNLPAPNAKTFIGEGKLLEITELAHQYDANMLVFDNELSPSKLRNIEEISGLTIIDRSNLILDIFAGRAQSLEGKLQVELAQYKYILPQLSGNGKSLSRQNGGIGTRGPGETKLETDKRHIHSRITKLEKELLEIRANRDTMRKSRLKSKHPSVSIIGYTNAGKSTLLNLLTNSEIHANNRLFDTLDTTTRKMKVSDTLDVFLSDTVGFIRKLPHHLVNAFQATLEETIHADLLLHVVDCANPEYLEHIKTVDAVLEKILDEPIKTITVFNKCDLCEDYFELEDSQVKISAKTSKGIPELLTLIEEYLSNGKHEVVLEIPYTKGYIIDELYKTSKVEILDYTEKGTKINLVCDNIVFAQMNEFLI